MTPLLAVGIVMSFVTLFLQEALVPYANDQLVEIESAVINHTSAFGRDLTVTAPLPGGGRQSPSQPPTNRIRSPAARHADPIRSRNRPRQIVFADRAEFTADKWLLQNSSLYRFNPDGSVLAEPPIPQQQVEIGQNPTDLVKRIKNDDPDGMSRAQIAAIVRTGQLTESELRKYVTTYQEKLARPFACFVFILIAVPFGLRAMSSGGSSTSLGFGLSLAIVFVYYIVMTVCSFFGEAFLAVAWLWAWMPNILFTAIGLARLWRAAMV